MNLAPEVIRTIDYCMKWGVNVCFSDVRNWNRITHSGPDCVDIDARTRELLLVPSNKWRQVGFLLHDLSHLICGEPISDANECEGPMLALDWAHHKFLKLMRGHSTMMSEFAVGHHAKTHIDEWPYQPYRLRRKLLEASRVKAEDLGLLVNWTPTFKPTVRGDLQ